MTKKGKQRLANARAHDLEVFSEAERCLDSNDSQGAIAALSRACNASSVLSFLQRARGAGKLTAEEVLQACAARDSISTLLARSFTRTQIDELLAKYEIAIQGIKTTEANRIKRSLKTILGGSVVDQLLEARRQENRVAEHPFDALARIASGKNAHRRRR